jgi:hypothetical protein
MNEPTCVGEIAATVWMKPATAFLAAEKYGLGTAGFGTSH